MDQKLREELARKIEAAFAKTPYPEKENLSREGTPEEKKEVQDAFAGKHWKELSRDTLYSYYRELPMFTAEAFRFFLPAFLRVAVLHHPRHDPLGDAVVLFLSPSTPEYPKSFQIHFQNQVNLFTEQERRMIINFLEVYLELDLGQDSFFDYNPEELESVIEFWKSTVK